ncbi:MAG: peroxiredoxin family protein [Nitrospiria bacterium]
MAKVGFTAPDLRLKNIKGDIISLDSLRGKIVLVNFWATWCAPCRSEMPSMEELYRSFDRRNFEILAISSDEDGLRSVKPFQEEYQFSFPILIDETLLINDLYGVSSIPTSMIVDRKGIITNRFFGAVDWNDPRQKNLIAQMINSPS